MRPLPVLVALALAAALAPTVVAEEEDPTSGNCDRVNVPLNVNIGFVCALAGLGTNATCPPHSETPIDPTCTSLYSWSWLAFSHLNLAGEVEVTINYDVVTCLDLVNAEPACEHHAGSTTQTCAWDYGGECRDSGRVDHSWGPVHLELGEQFTVNAHIDIRMHATSHVLDVPIGDVEYGDFSDWGAAVGVVDNGRD